MKELHLTLPPADADDGPGLPHNEFDELKHCWLVGGGTHPGSGLPTILESARITTNAILSKEKHSHKTTPHQEKGSAS